MKKFKKPDRSGGERRGPRPPHRGGGPGGSRPHSGRQGHPVQQGRGHDTHGVPRGRPVVGIHAVNELIKVRARDIAALWIREQYKDHPELAALYDSAQNASVRIQLQNPGALDKIVGAHQGVIAFASAGPEADWPAIDKSEKCTLVALDEVEDPHNLGAIMRTAWLFGAEAILTPEHRAANISPAVSKVAQGAAEHIPVERESALPERLKQLKENGFWILGLSHEAKQDIYSFEIPKKVVWVLGSESSGLRKSVAGACDDFIKIPQAAPEASYNVSVAAAVALSETYRQRHS
jgi:23S rRNA (guanosine2251-2'-O)-methyltransferase